MLDRDTRAAILSLAELGHGKAAIAQTMRVSRNAVRRVLADGHVEVPAVARASRLDRELDAIRELHIRCKGNLMRVHEELTATGTEVAYATLTAFCRRHGIGVKVKVRAGQYTFAPGEEMQHDTSPHEVTIGRRRQVLQCASVVLCFSRKQYAQLYPRWSRLECRHFLSTGVVYLGGAAGRCMVDNSSVVLGSGTGKNAVPAAEMAALGDRFGFDFVAHELGDANRSGRVERPFHYIENNFYVGRTFDSLADLNAQLIDWLARDFSRTRKRLGASPAELFRSEAPALKPLPLHVPAVYVLHRRRVDAEGYINLHTNRYSVDAKWIHRRLDVRETVEAVRIWHGHELLSEHVKEPYGAGKRATLPQHQTGRRPRRAPVPLSDEERLLRAQGPEMDALIDALRRKHGGRAARAVRQLHRMWHDYPSAPVSDAIGEALKYGLTDPARIERMVLRRIAGDFFRIPIDHQEHDHERRPAAAAHEPQTEASEPEPG